MNVQEDQLNVIFHQEGDRITAVVAFTSNGDGFVLFQKVADTLRASGSSSIMATRIGSDWAAIWVMLFYQAGDDAGVVEKGTVILAAKPPSGRLNSSNDCFEP